MVVNPASSLELEAVSRHIEGRAVLSDISLAIPPGRITCVLGQSGCGKSTLLRSISGVDRPDPGGRIRLGGIEVTGDHQVTVHFVAPDSTFREARAG